MKKTLDDGLTNPDSREYLEEDVRKVFSNGEAAFALNWTYMYELANDPKESKVAGKVGIVPAPGVEGKSDRLRRQRLDGPRHHLDQPERRRGLEVHHLPDLAADAEKIRQTQPADLEGLLQRSGGDGGAGERGRGGQDLDRRRCSRGR